MPPRLRLAAASDTQKQVKHGSARKPRETRTEYELRLGRNVVWRGRDLLEALRRLERRHGRGKLAIRVVFNENLLIAVRLSA